MCAGACRAVGIAGRRHAPRWRPGFPWGTSLAVSGDLVRLSHSCGLLDRVEPGFHELPARPLGGADKPDAGRVHQLSGPRAGWLERSGRSIDQRGTPIWPCAIRERYPNAPREQAWSNTRSLALRDLTPVAESRTVIQQSVESGDRHHERMSQRYREGPSARSQCLFQRTPHAGQHGPPARRRHVGRRFRSGLRARHLSRIAPRRATVSAGQPDR